MSTSGERASGGQHRRVLAIAAWAVVVACGLSACDRPPVQSQTPAGSPSQAPAPPPPPAPATLPVAAASASGVATPDVVASMFPAADMARRLAGDRLRVDIAPPAEADPARWRPEREDIARIQSARLVVLNGARFERWAGKAALPASRTVDLSAPFAAEFVKYKTITHSHGPSGAHSHEGIDGHTWMDPVLAQAQARTLAAAMSAAWPAHATVIESNLASLLADLADLDARWRALVPALRGVRLMANHPAYNYPAKRYGLAIENLDVPPDAEPDAEQWGQVTAALKTPGPSRAVMLFESAPRASTVARLTQEHAVHVVVFEPCETPATDGALLVARMRANLDRLAAALESTETSGAD